MAHSIYLYKYIDLYFSEDITSRVFRLSMKKKKKKKKGKICHRLLLSIFIRIIRNASIDVIAQLIYKAQLSIPKEIYRAGRMKRI